MANDDRQSEQFIREVDEELRRAQLKSIWDRFFPLIIGVCVLIVAVTAGYRGWLWWQERQASAAGDKFLSALEEIQTGDRAAGEAELQSIADEAGGGYPILARLRLAGEKASAGQPAEAITAFDAISADTSVTEPLRSLARMRAALVALDMGDLDGARERAEPLNLPGGVWRHSAREVLGTAAYHAGNLQEARDFFSQIQGDAETPGELWMRASWMMGLIDGQLAEPTAAGDAAAPVAGDASAPASTDGAAPVSTGADAPTATGGAAPTATENPVPSGTAPASTETPAATEVAPATDTSGSTAVPASTEAPAAGDPPVEGTTEPPAAPSTDAATAPSATPATSPAPEVPASSSEPAPPAATTETPAPTAPAATEPPASPSPAPASDAPASDAAVQPAEPPASDGIAPATPLPGEAPALEPAGSAPADAIETPQADSPVVPPTPISPQ